MSSTFLVGVILCTGFLLGECVRFIKLPKVTGYILAGILLNPQVCPFVPADFPQHTELITNIALAFITFSVGGTLGYSRIKALGRIVISITVFEAEMAFLAVAVPFALLGPLLMPGVGSSWVSVYFPFSILLAALAAPTDPSATLAVVHEYKAKGDVTSTIMGVAAFDDILGIMNYSLAVVVSSVLISHSSLNAGTLIVKPGVIIIGSVLLGTVFGLVLNIITRLNSRESDGVLIVLVFGLLSLCFGMATFLGVDELLATVAMGTVVVNFNRIHKKIFGLLERYTEELVFVLFFTISGMHLNFSILYKNLFLIILFAGFRGLGKFSGVFLGSRLSRAPVKIQKYTAGGLIPQGGIVVGLALLVQNNPLFSNFSEILINTIIGATVLHELLGPVLAKNALAQAGEIKG